jgi:hypothetical protein
MNVKYTLYVNQRKVKLIYLIVATILMVSHKFTGFGFAGFTIALIGIIDCTEIGGACINEC